MERERKKREEKGYRHPLFIHGMAGSAGNGTERTEALFGYTAGGNFVDHRAGLCRFHPERAKLVPSGHPAAFEISTEIPLSISNPISGRPKTGEAL